MAADTVNLLRRRAAFLAAIRAFFAARGVIEADTALLRDFGVSDPALTSIPAGSGWLITSPEYALKELLSLGAPDLYQLSHVFRAEEQGRRHAQEFLLLEWYRIGYDAKALMHETACFINEMLETSLPVKTSPYAALFREHLQLDFFASDTSDLQARAARLLPESADWQMDKNGWADLLFTHAIEPALGINCIEFVTDYPTEQAALARLTTDAAGNLVAARFEAYINGLELCNGFHELTDAAEQRRRFAADNRERARLNLPEMPADTGFLKALECGLPDCAGVALGADRLFMLKENAARIQDVQLLK